MEKTTQVVTGVTQFPVTVRYADYRSVHGVMLPFKIVSKTVQLGEIVTQFDTATKLAELDDGAFRLTR